MNGKVVLPAFADGLTCESGCQYFHRFPNGATGCIAHPPTVTIMMVPIEGAVVRSGGPQFSPRELAAYPPVGKGSPACGEFKIKTGDVS